MCVILDRPICVLKKIVYEKPLLHSEVLLPGAIIEFPTSKCGVSVISRQVENEREKIAGISHPPLPPLPPD